MPTLPKCDTSNRLRVIDDREYDDEWDAQAGAEPAAGFMQSSFWARFKESEGYRTRRYGYYDGDRLAGGAVVQHFAARADQFGMVVCPEGPVAPWLSDPSMARTILRSLQVTVQADFPDALGLRIEPHLAPPRPSLIRNLQRAPLDLTPTATLMLDLTQSDDDLLASMRPKGRYNIRLAERNGVSVYSSMSMSDLQPFYSLFRATADRQDFFAEPYGFFLNLAAALFPAGAAEFYFAVKGDAVLAAALVVYYGRRATYLYGASSTEHRNQMSNYLLHWRAIREARERGCLEYDFYGYDPFGIPDHPYAGFSRFKRQFGGAVVSSIGAYDYFFYDRLAERLIPQLRTAHEATNGGRI